MIATLLIVEIVNSLLMGRDLGQVINSTTLHVLSAVNAIIVWRMKALFPMKEGFIMRNATRRSLGRYVVNVEGLLMGNTWKTGLILCMRDVLKSIRRTRAFYKRLPL